MSSIDLCSILTMEDIFSRLLNLTSYMNQTFIRFIEDVMFRDMSRWFEDSEVIFCGFGCNERGDSVLEDRPFIDSRLQIVNTSSNYGGVRFVFKGMLFYFMYMVEESSLILPGDGSCNLVYFSISFVFSSYDHTRSRDNESM
ncbi:uncharacterized protein [Henckelia pumila]|uniref:uncharacterized protein isoform X3 n=1 Tax=Henckelia pumila TaxID=405737 RepID=UPI003C6DFE52